MTQRQARQARQARKARRRRQAVGAVMMETVLVMPLLLVILSLLFYFGRLAVRVQHDQVMSRYETWRQVHDASGPRSDIPEGHPQLNSAFFAGRAESISHTLADNRFPDAAYRDLIDAAGEASVDAGDLTHAMLYRPNSDEPRFPHGHREGFRVNYTTDVPLWERIEGPIDRHQARIEHEWLFSNSTTAGADTWRGSGTGSHHLRAVRDVFLEDFDDQLDRIDGDTNPEYDTDDTQRSSAAHLAALIRRLYLNEVGYDGPIVYDERP